MSLILGIDPGLRITGYGLIETRGADAIHVASGCIRAQGEALPARLGVIFSGVMAVLEEFNPDELAIEQVFMSRNADSALKLGQARGAAICAGVSRQLPVAEYTPRQIKQAVTGTGGADKEQVQHMVRVLCGVKGPLVMDASDALAVALCHKHMSSTLARLGMASGFRGGRMR